MPLLAIINSLTKKGRKYSGGKRKQRYKKDRKRDGNEESRWCHGTSSLRQIRIFVFLRCHPFIYGSPFFGEKIDFFW
jgi:hypothetical protein